MENELNESCEIVGSPGGAGKFFPPASGDPPGFYAVHFPRVNRFDKKRERERRQRKDLRERMRVGE